MRKRMARAALLALAACLALALCACTEGYTPASKDPTVDSSALLSSGTLKVGVDASSYPFAGQAKGGINGIDVDIAAALADELGLKLELVDIGMNGATALSAGEVDIVMGFDKAETPGDKCWTSEPYLDSCAAIFSLDAQSQPPARDASTQIAAQSSSLSAYLVTQYYGSEALKAESELKTVFQDLDQDVVKYAASDAVVGSYLANTLGIDAAIVGLLEEPGSYCVGVSPANTTLQLAVTQALSAIEGNGVLPVIMTRWLGGEPDLSALELAEPVRAELDRKRQEAEEAERAAAEDAPAEEAAPSDGEA